MVPGTKVKKLHLFRFGSRNRLLKCFGGLTESILRDYVIIDYDHRSPVYEVHEVTGSNLARIINNFVD